MCCRPDSNSGLGITLTASSTMVFYSLDYSMSNSSRQGTDPPGRTEDALHLHTFGCKGTVMKRFLKALKIKANLAKTLVDDYRTGGTRFIREEKNMSDSQRMFDSGRPTKDFAGSKKRTWKKRSRMSMRIEEVDFSWQRHVGILKTKLHQISVLFCLTNTTRAWLRQPQKKALHTLRKKATESGL